MYLMCGPRQLFFHCGAGMPNDWTPLHEDESKATLLKVQSNKSTAIGDQISHTDFFLLNSSSQDLATKIKFALWIKPNWNEQAEAEGPILVTHRLEGHLIHHLNQDTSESKRDAKIN